jgi:hypothetical protein
MNIEELSKAQLILLTILVNFVTSIATGILTVSLLDRAPAFVTQTVNRVVERTIETIAAVAPAAIIQSSPAPSNQDLVTAAIAVNAMRVVAIYSAETGTSTPALAIGTYLSKSRAVVTAAQDILPGEVLVEFTNGAYIAASLAHAGKGIAIYGFAGSASLPKMTSPTLIASGDLKLGGTVLALSADGAASTGIVSRVSVKGVYTTLPDIGTGSAAVDLSGNLIGIATGVTPGFLVGANTITALLTATSTTATSTAATR